MAFAIGRIAMPQEPLIWQHAGDSVTFSGGFTLSPIDAAMALREQLLGYAVNADEPVIPITSDADPRISGFYRVTGVNIPTPPEALINGHLEYSIQATRLSAFQAATFESVLNGALMVNANGVASATAQPYHAVPTARWEYVPLSSAVSSTLVRTGRDGQVNCTFIPSVYKGLARFSVLPASYYIGAAQVRDESGSGHTICGTRESPYLWSMDNGLLQLKGGATDLVLNIWKVGTGWVPWYPGASNGLLYFQGVALGRVAAIANTGSRILRNSPEECIVRWSAGLVGIYPITIDLSLRRGSRLVRAYLTSSTADTWYGVLGDHTASSAIISGMRATSNDAYGNRFVLATSNAFTADYVNGNLASSAAVTAMNWGIGIEYGGSGAVTKDTAQDIAYQYLAAQSERTQVVNR